MNVGENPVGGIDVVLRDVFSNFVEIGERIGSAAAYLPDRLWRTRLRSFLNASSPSIGFTRPNLEIVVAAVERLPD